MKKKNYRNISTVLLSLIIFKIYAYYFSKTDYIII